MPKLKFLSVVVIFFCVLACNGVVFGDVMYIPWGSAMSEDSCGFKNPDLITYGAIRHPSNLSGDVIYYGYISEAETIYDYVGNTKVFKRDTFNGLYPALKRHLLTGMLKRRHLINSLQINYTTYHL